MMNRLLKEEILNELNPHKVSTSFSFYVLGKLPIEKIEGYLTDYKQHFLEIIRKKMEEDLPTDTNDEYMNDFNKNKVAHHIQQLSDRSMMDLESWVNQLKISKNDWKEVFDEIEQL